jgi:hypothetical protein
VRARAIEQGRDYWVRVRLAPVKRVTSVPHGGRGWPGWVGRRRATVVELVAETGRRQALAVVETDGWECANAHEFAAAELSRAMLAGQLRYRPCRRRWTVPVRDVLSPTRPPAPAARPEAERERVVA